MKEKISIGVLGCSSIAERQVIPAILKSKRFELKYVASRSSRKGKNFADKFKSIYCEYDDLISSDEVNAIYLSLPAALHYYWGKKVIEKGKHLLMEKPFTHSLRTSQEIIFLAKKNKLIAMEGLVYVYHPLHKTVFSLLNRGEIGEVKHVDAYFGFPSPDKNDIRQNSKLGGGAILDNLIYPLSFCINFQSNVLPQISYYIKFDRKNEVDERGVILMNFGKITANINYGFGLMYRNSYCIWGSKGYLMSERVFSRPETMREDIVIIKQNEEKRVVVEPENQFVVMLNAFADKIQKKTNSKMNEGDDILKRMKIISAMYEYAKKNRRRL